MFDFSSLPLTPEHARAARNYLGFSQATAAQESGLPVHKIKRFEAGNYLPDVEFLTDLREFFEARGYRFEDTPEPGAKAKGEGRVFPAGVVGGPLENQGATKGKQPATSKVHHMRIAMDDEGAMGRALDLIDDNEERIQKLMQEPIESGFLGGLSDKSEARHAEVLALMAENGALFAKLFGRVLGGDPRPELAEGKAKPTTHADLVHRRHADMHEVLAGSRDAAIRRKNRQPANTVHGALFG